jgi:amino acid adenylation domain-containing protein
MRAQSLDETRPDRAVRSTLHAAFEAQVERTPDAVALSFRGEQLTYAELNARANRLAHRLRALGVGRESLVGLSVARSFDVLVGMLGIMKAGGAYVPIDPAYPAERKALLLADAQLPLVVTQPEVADGLPLGATRVLVNEAAQDGDARNPEGVTDPDSLLYVIYTSGSTGKPKGVMVTHWNVVRIFSATRAWFEFSAADVCTLFHSYSFGFSVWEIWSALLHGARLLIVPDGTSPEELHALARREGVTFLSLTPSGFRQFVAADEQAPRDAGRSHLRVIALSGEATVGHDLARWFERRGDERPMVASTYAITETGGQVTYQRLRRGASARAIGQPLPDMQVHVLDERLQPSAAGELYVGGAGLARGYLHRPELTSERFIEHPSFGRLYRTGDAAKRTESGELELAGRVDDQVKLHGMRVEPGEVESALRDHHAVREAVVLAVGEGDERRLVAWLATARPLSASELRRHLSSRLPAPYVPSAFVFVPALPRNPNGKLDRAALPPPAPIRPFLDAPFVAPHDSDERQLAELWCEVLRVDRVGVDDDFFDLGGTSLKAVELFSRVRKRFGIDLPLSTLLEAPTVRKLSSALHSRGPARRFLSLVPLQTSGTRPPLFFVHGGGGNILDLPRLARELGPEQPFYGLQAVGLDGRHPLPATIEATAAIYLGEVRRIQARGPYHLGGLCLGGVIAYEMAQQLLDAGEEVALLAVLDTLMAPGRYVDRPRKALSLFRQGEYRRLSKFVQNQILKRVKDQVVGLRDPQVRISNRLERSFNRARRRYRPRPYPRPIELLRMGDADDAPPEHERDWAMLAAGGLRTRLIAGHHNEVMGRALPEVAAHLGEAMTRAQHVRFAHIINPVHAPRDESLASAQTITFESMRRAKAYGESAAPLMVDLFTAQYPEDRALLDGFCATADLSRSVMDCGVFPERRKLPLIGDILARLYACSGADYFIYTNVDIALQPRFYVEVSELLKQGYDAISLTRRTVMATPDQARDLEWLCQQKGEPHPGYDCFVFRRELLQGVDFHELCIGFPPIGMTLMAVLSTRARRFRFYEDQFLTFHINDDRSWRTPRLDAFWHHNRAAALRTLAELEAGDRPLSEFAQFAKRYIGEKSGF